VRPVALIDAGEEQQFGGKASKLALALKAGLPVPPGFSLGTVHVEAVANSHEETLNNLRESFKALGGPCAVRSSAIGEDSDAASFAGQHLTLLNIRHEDEIVPAVLQVRASAHTEAARAYRRKMGLDETPRVAVVVQRMIEPTCAGVMFTKHPISGEDQRVIEAAWGLGEAVVAGLVVPDNFVLSTDGKVLKRLIGVKDIALRSNPDGGTVEEPVDEELIDAASLSDSQLSQLHELARLCEAHFGSGLDIEWGFVQDKLFLLQCRSMTRNRTRDSDCSGGL
jgi:pyruvate, water dikinase